MNKDLNFTTVILNWSLSLSLFLVVGTICLIAFFGLPAKQKQGLNTLSRETVEELLVVYAKDFFKKNGHNIDNITEPRLKILANNLLDENELTTQKICTNLTKMTIICKGACEVATYRQHEKIETDDLQIAYDSAKHEFLKLELHQSNPDQL